MLGAKAFFNCALFFPSGRSKEFHILIQKWRVESLASSNQNDEHNPKYGELGMYKTD